MFTREIRIPENLLLNLSYAYLRRELWVPLEEHQGRVSVIVDDPDNILKRDMIENFLRKKKIEYCLAEKEDILKYIDYFYGVELPPDASEKEGNGTGEPGGGGMSEVNADIIKLVNDLIEEAYVRRASDIHIEPDVKDRQVNVRLRIDGECIPYKTFPYELPGADHFPGQDHVQPRYHGKAPPPGRENHVQALHRGGARTAGGHHAHLRLHGRCGAPHPDPGEDHEPGRTQHARRNLRAHPQAHYQKPYGLILLVGPTGSGKTTTAHAVLQVLNKPNVKIWTVEDPVEITQRGIRQVQVHHKIGLDFSSAMRSFLRSDPDIIMVGEMRDYETAKMGVEASTTGHLVLSTLHTNNAPETIVRLLEIGIDPFAFSDSLLCVLAQRLVRALCPLCKEAYHPGREEFEELHPPRRRKDIPGAGYRL